MVKFGFLTKSLMPISATRTNSHLLTIAASARLLSDQIISSPILMESDGAGPSASGEAAGSSGQFEFGVDPSMDPELAMALRMSLEEEQARQRAAEGASAAPDLPPISETGIEPSAATETTAMQSDAPTSSALGMPSKGSLVLPGADPLAGTGNASQDESEEAMLKQAIALSHSQDSQAVAGQGRPESSSAPREDQDLVMGEESAGQVAQAADEDEDMDEEEAIARAIEMSLKGDKADQK